jgi:hypothetical protein
MFPIASYAANGAAWAQEGEARADYFGIGITNYELHGQHRRSYPLTYRRFPARG